MAQEQGGESLGFFIDTGPSDPTAGKWGESPSSYYFQSTYKALSFFFIMALL
jgi:hypothetical protein